MVATLVAFAILLALSFARVPLAIAMLIVGVGGFATVRGWVPAFEQLATITWDTAVDYELSVVPLFILMGNFVSRAGMSQELFTAAYRFIGHLRGGLAMSTIVACAGFGAICGSSIATAATMARVAYPSMRKLGYSDKLAASSIAAGGTLGILIPPSTIMVIYGIMTETNIGKLFAAGVIPGALATLLLCLAVRWVVWRDPASGPQGARSTWRERYAALKGVEVFALFAFVLWLVGSQARIRGDLLGMIFVLGSFGLAFYYKGVASVIALFAMSIGGIYAGWFTATEGAGIGAFGAFLFALARRALSWRSLFDILVESALTTSMLFMILIGALVFASFINFTSMPTDLKEFVESFKLHPLMVVVAICAIYVILGTAMEELSMILLTVPVFFPLVTSLGFDPVWFGILIVVVVEIGLISPPVGMNLFVLNSLLPQVSTGTLFRGVTPFVIADVIRLGILVAFPAISLWLPSVLAIK